MADSLCYGDVRTFGFLPLWAEPWRVATALDYLGKRISDYLVARSVDRVFLVRRSLRKLQQDLWLARSDYRFHDLGLAVDHRCLARC